MELVPLHKSPEYLGECTEVLNEEWPRSTTARLHSLEKSCDDLPSCFILLDNTSETKALIGHSRLNRVQGRDGSCLVESVVIRRDLRGKGYGRKIMLETEKLAKSQGFHTMYLTTHDKQKFYERLGYEYCQPVICVGGKFANLPESFKKALAGVSGSEKGKLRDVQTRNTDGIETKSLMHELTISDSFVPTSPPPPHCPSNQAPSPPHMPAPPLPPPPPALSSKGNPGTKNVERWDPGHVSWMKKDL